MVNVQIKLSRKFIYSLIIIGVFFSLIIGIYAYGGNNPSEAGHSGNEIHVTVQGETKLLNNALNDLYNTPESSNLECVRVDDTNTEFGTPNYRQNSITINCPSDYTVTGGSCKCIDTGGDNDELVPCSSDYPNSGLNGWQCGSGGTYPRINGWAVCCK